MFIINHNVCTDSLDMVGHSYQGIVRTFREPKFAHANWRANFASKAFKGQWSQASYVNSPCTTTLSESECKPESLTGETDSKLYCVGVPSSSHLEGKLRFLKNFLSQFKFLSLAPVRSMLANILNKQVYSFHFFPTHPHHRCPSQTEVVLFSDQDWRTDICKFLVHG